MWLTGSQRKGPAAVAAGPFVSISIIESGGKQSAKYLEAELRAQSTDLPVRVATLGSVGFLAKNCPAATRPARWWSGIGFVFADMELQEFGNRDQE